MIGWSLWSKDLIILITADSRAGPQAWVDAYHDVGLSPSVSPLHLKSGAIQGVVVLDYPGDARFDSLFVVYEGINGQLPNLDLINTAVHIADGQMGLPVHIQEMFHASNTAKDRLRTMLRGMVNQGLGHATGPHSSFIPYHIDAITLRVAGEGRHDELSLGRTVESLMRSLNNLLEHFHQSFFFYVLLAPRRFVSVGTYLPSAMLVAVNFTFTAIALWIKTAQVPPEKSSKPQPEKSTDNKQDDADKEAAALLQPSLEDAPSERPRELFWPLVFVIGTHFLGSLPLYLFNNLPKNVDSPSFIYHTSSRLTSFFVAAPRTRLLRLLRLQPHPAIPGLLPSRPLLRAHPRRLRPNQKLLPPPTRSLPVHTCHAQLQPLILGRPLLRRLHLHLRACPCASYPCCQPRRWCRHPGPCTDGCAGGRRGLLA